MAEQTDPVRDLYQKAQKAKAQRFNVHPWLFGLPGITAQATQQTAKTDDTNTPELPPAA